MLTYKDLVEAKKEIESKDFRPLTYEEFLRIRQKNRETYEKLKGCTVIVKAEEVKNGTV